MSWYNYYLSGLGVAFIFAGIFRTFNKSFLIEWLPSLFMLLIGICLIFIDQRIYEIEEEAKEK